MTSSRKQTFSRMVADRRSSPSYSSAVRNREFWKLVDEVLGQATGRALARDQVLPALGNRTPAQAIDDGVAPRDVWHAFADAMDIPDARRWGADGDRKAPPRSR
jgi:hypothetical protein